MLSSNKSDFVVKLSIKDNTDGSNTYPINGCIITDDNLDKFDIDEKKELLVYNIYNFQLETFLEGIQQLTGEILETN